MDGGHSANFITFSLALLYLASRSAISLLLPSAACVSSKWIFRRNLIQKLSTVLCTDTTTHVTTQRKAIDTKRGFMNAPPRATIYVRSSSTIDSHYVHEK